jgi:hypothetical protein
MVQLFITVAWTHRRGWQLTHTGCILKVTEPIELAGRLTVGMKEDPESFGLSINEEEAAFEMEKAAGQQSLTSWHLGQGLAGKKKQEEWVSSLTGDTHLDGVLSQGWKRD